MRFSKFLGLCEKKQLSARALGSSSVHPTGGAAYGREGPFADASLTKVVDLLGAQSESEYLQILALFSNCQKQERQESEDLATPRVGSSYGDGEGEAEEEEEEEDQGDIASRSSFLHPHLPASQYSQDQTSTTTSLRHAGAMPVSPRRTSAEEFRSSGSFQSATSRGRHSSTSEEASPTPLSPERHYLPSPQLPSVKDLSQMCHPLPAPPSQSAKNAISAASCKNRSTSLRNSAARQLPLPSESPPAGFTRFTDRVLDRGVSDTTRELDKVYRRSSWTSGPALCKSLTQAVQEAIFTERPRSTGSASIGELPMTPLECPCPPLSTPQHSPPGTPSRVHELYRLTEPPVPRKTRCKSTPSSATSSPPQMRTHIQASCNLSPSYTPPLSPVTCIDSPSRPSWSQVPRCPSKWTKGAKLGQGTFGTVYEGWNQEDGSFFAVKVGSVEDSSPEIQREVEVLSRLEHPNIVRYLGSSVEEGNLCIFLELVRMGSLESIMKKYRRFKDSTIRTYTRQILHGLEYLHERKTIHRDIKCANILVDVNGQVKLADFGVAKRVEQSLASSIKGTPLYMAPEVLTAHGNNYGFPADIWSLGCTVLEMAAGKPPWSDLHGFGFFFKVKNGELPSIPEHTSPEGKDFILRCLRFEPQDRPTAKELLQHPFVANVPIPEDVIWSCSSSAPVSPGPWASPRCYPFLVQGRLL